MSNAAGKDEVSLDDLARIINDFCDQADKDDQSAEEPHDLSVRAQVRASTRRERAGEYLIQAKAQVPHGEWITWCEANIRRSIRDIQKLMKIAQDDNPEQAAAEEREAVREQVARHRAKANAQVRRMPH